MKWVIILGLYHTFEGLNCANTNCATDGDHGLRYTAGRILSTIPLHAINPKIHAAAIRFPDLLWICRT